MHIHSDVPRVETEQATFREVVVKRDDIHMSDLMQVSQFLDQQSNMPSRVGVVNRDRDFVFQQYVSGKENAAEAAGQRQRVI
jgi:hypothetical protein